MQTIPRFWLAKRFWEKISPKKAGNALTTRRCIKCNSCQSRLNKGALCKQCFNKKIKLPIANEKVNNSGNLDNKNDSATDLNYDPTNDRSMIDVIKESMIKEREWNENTQTILFNQVEFLKQEIAVKVS